MCDKLGFFRHTKTSMTGKFTRSTLRYRVVLRLFRKGLLVRVPQHRNGTKDITSMFDSISQYSGVLSEYIKGPTCLKFPHFPPGATGILCLLRIRVVRNSALHGPLPQLFSCSGSLAKIPLPLSPPCTTTYAGIGLKAKTSYSAGGSSICPMKLNIYRTDRFRRLRRMTDCGWVKVKRNLCFKKGLFF